MQINAVNAPKGINSMIRACRRASRWRAGLVASIPLLLCISVKAEAQETMGVCAEPDSIAVRGISRVSAQSVMTDGGLTKTNVTFPSVARAIRSLYATQQFENVSITCDQEAVPGSTILVYTVKERPLLGEITVIGPQAISERSVRDKIDLFTGRPLDPALVTRARARIDSTYEKSGYYLAKVVIDSTEQPDGRIALTFTVDEGRRLAISGIDIVGNSLVSEKTVVGAMKTKPEGFWFFRKGEFDEDNFVGDMGERIPMLYSRLGFVDARVIGDSLIVEREQGKGLLRIEVEEGPRYRVGDFEIAGNRRFSTEEVRRFYPFDSAGQSATLTERLKGVVFRKEGAPEGIFDQQKWDESIEKINNFYRNQGYLYAQIRPVVERRVAADSEHVVNLRWEIDERNPAIINRILVLGNDYTTEDCIRRQIFLVPGGVFNQDMLVQSYQSISNLGFFESPMPFPDYRPINDAGDVDIVFRVKEKRTGSFNFGASMGQGGVGFGGFITVEQPNLFGLCKRGQLNWQYGRFFNDFSATFSDPALRGSRVSGMVSAYRSQSRFIVSNLGSNIRTGAQLRFGLPTPWSYRSTLSLSYNGEAATFSGGQSTGLCTRNCFRSNVGLGYTYDTRIGLPFAFAGSLRSVDSDFSGGPLGGSVNFQRVTAEYRAYVPIAQFGGTNPGSQPIQLVMGMTARGGALFGNSGPFFFQQKFAVGGVQFGQMLRGYPEFSVSPVGYLSNTSQQTADTISFGNSFTTLSGEIGVRLNQMMYFNVFADAGNNWKSPREFNPTRLYRSAGVGVSTVTPMGPLGLDLAYGFDRTAVDPATGRSRPDPRWQFHFRLGQLF